MKVLFVWKKFSSQSCISENFPVVAGCLVYYGLEERLSSVEMSFIVSYSSV